VEGIFGAPAALGSTGFHSVRPEFGFISLKG
jgi:hypothetical protein